MNHKPIVLIVLDGWGCREAAEDNAIAANSPYFHELLGKYPNTLLSCSGKEVGLPLGLMGNSEVGHMNLGAGRVIWQDITRIDLEIEKGSFFDLGAFVQVMDRVKRENKQLHLTGLVSDGGVHASDVHLRNLLKMAAQRGLAKEQVCVHAILDGRDTAPRDGARYIAALEKDIEDAGVGRIVSVIGRYFAMDRDTNWERVKKAYDLMVGGVGARANDAQQAVRDSYDANIGDEFVEPIVIGDPSEGRVGDGDGLISFNYRSDRVRQFCMAFGLDDFSGFDRGKRPQVEIVTMTQYRADFPFAIAFPPRELKGLYSEIVSAAGLRQERIAETEKYAHVTFFFSGGKEEELPGESRTLIPSPKVATYDMQPEMSSAGVRDALIKSLKKGETDVYIVNFANADMVGHTGDIPATIAAIRAVDACLQQIVPVVTERGGVVAITADHGNAEQLWDPISGQPHTAHTTNPVPIVMCSNDLIGAKMRGMGILSDVTPTLIDLAGLKRSPEMDGASLLL
ncbi:MAG: 2,3-bisphosphoglycerate-independent phosphoglycerate mutase [Planctomycetota bacterium]|jgi:2,3-bisphosphoglycerate-independent phosphoglycerate mutase